MFRQPLFPKDRFQEKVKFEEDISLSTCRLDCGSRCLNNPLKEKVKFEEDISSLASRMFRQPLFPKDRFQEKAKFEEDISLSTSRLDHKRKCPNVPSQVKIKFEANNSPLNSNGRRQQSPNIPRSPSVSIECYWDDYNGTNDLFMDIRNTRLRISKAASAGKWSGDISEDLMDDE